LQAESFDQQYSSILGEVGCFVFLVSCRASALEAWHNQGAGLSPQQPLDLSTPFRPAALLNALEQQACRTAGVALGLLELASCWPGARHVDGKGGFAVQVTGVLLQGALFDGYSLQPVQQVGIKRERSFVKRQISYSNGAKQSDTSLSQA
jgi:hypothetical protein